MAFFKRSASTPVERLMTAVGLPKGGGEVPVADIVMDLVQRGGKRVGAALAVVEELLAEAPDVAVDFLEDLQNVMSYGPVGLDAATVLPMRGPRTLAAWDTIDRFWTGVVAWCDENGIELGSSEPLRQIDNAELRKIIWTSSRGLPDGRSIGLAEIVQYEIAGGVPMRIPRHQPN